MKVQQKLFARKLFDCKWNPAALFVLAAAIHFLLCLSVFLVGRYDLAPQMFDTGGVGMFATDAGRFQSEIQLSVEQLQRHEIAGWLTAAPPLHIKLYSLCAVLVEPLVGPGILNVEPLNLLYFLATLILVFKLGEVLGGKKTGMLAAVIVALWPSFLLHSVQPLRDPLFIVTMLAWMLFNLRWLTRNFSSREALANTAAGIGLSVVFFLVKNSMWELVLALALLPLLFLIIRQIVEKRLLTANLIGATLLLVAVVMIPKLLGPLLKPTALPVENVMTGRKTAALPRINIESQRKMRFLDLPKRIVEARSEFKRQYESPGSNIDAEVHFNDSLDIVRYVPRAMVIGFFAPFPNMWLAPALRLAR